MGGRGRDERSARCTGERRAGVAARRNEKYEREKTGTQHGNERRGPTRFGRLSSR